MSALIGAGIGLLVGGVGAFVWCVQIPADNAGGAAFVVAALGGIAGAILGALLGWLLF